MKLKVIFIVWIAFLCSFGCGSELPEIPEWKERAQKEAEQNECIIMMYRDFHRLTRDMVFEAHWEIESWKESRAIQDQEDKPGIYSVWDDESWEQVLELDKEIKSYMQEVSLERDSLPHLPILAGIHVRMIEVQKQLR